MKVVAIRKNSQEKEAKIEDYVGLNLKSNKVLQGISSSGFITPGQNSAAVTSAATLKEKQTQLRAANNTFSGYDRRG